MWCKIQTPNSERQDLIYLNGVGAADKDSCCGTCRAIVSACAFADHVACIKNARICERNTMTGVSERPLRPDGGCCRSCKPHQLPPLPPTTCGPTCTGKDRVCIPLIDRDGNVRRENVCRRIIRRDYWVPRFSASAAFDSDTATAYCRAILERTHQLRPRLFAKLLHYWHVSYATLATTCNAGSKPTDRPDSDCISFFLVVPAPPASPTGTISRSVEARADFPTNNPDFPNADSPQWDELFDAMRDGSSITAEARMSGASAAVASLAAFVLVLALVC